MSVRYAHRYNGTYVCGGVAEQMPPCEGQVVLRYSILVPPEWNTFLRYNKWMRDKKGWTLDLYVGDRKFRLGEVALWRGAVWEYKLLKVEDPRGKDLVDEEGQYDGWELDVSVHVGNAPSLLIGLFAFRNVSGDAPVYTCFKVESLLFNVKEKEYWGKIRKWVVARSVLLYWEELTAHRMQKDGTAYLRDMEEMATLLESLCRHE